jgi:outer membrane protein OmpA-like peptidoglycan-associated protein
MVIKLLVLLLILLPFFTLAQQEKNTATKAQNELDSVFTEQYPAWVGYETNRFWDNWYVSAGGGMQMYFGTADGHEKFTGRLASAMDISAGKWFMPVLGLRLQAGGGELKGLAVDQNAFYLTGESNPEGFWKQQWKQVNAHMDILINLSNWIGGYRTKRFYEMVPYFGFGSIHAYRSGGLTVLTANAGVVHKFRLGEFIDVNLEMKGMILDKKFSGEASGTQNAIGGVSVGISYKFRQREFRNTGSLLTQKEKELATAQQELAKAQADIVVIEEEKKNIEEEKKVLEEEKNKLSEELKTATTATAEALKAMQAVEREAAKAVEKAMMTHAVRVNPVVVFFNINTTQVSDRGYVNLQYIAKAIRQNPDKVFTISGYADSQTGNTAYNLKLSRRRAQNVYNLLTREFGVNPAQLKAEGKGGVEKLFKNTALSRAAIVE